MKFDNYTVTGEKKGSLSGVATLFEAKVNPDLMHRAVVLRLANKRNPIAHTKTRGEIIATTKKAFKQKGTGNARRGALTTNLLRGGGVTHGPRNTRNFTKMMPKKERRAALFSSLSVKARDGNILGFDGLDIETPKTKTFMSLLAKLPEGKKYLFVLPQRDEVFRKSSQNVPGVRTILGQYLNPYDVLWADKICFVGDALSVVEKNFVA
jgi:large subunit ribosomal protein L4